MKLPPYSKYKPTDVEWLPKVPDHWDVKRSDGLVSADRAQVAPQAFVGREVFHYSIPIVQENGTGQVENGDALASAKQVVTKPVVLVSKLNPRKATICIAQPQPDLLTLCSTEFVALNADRCELRFLDYLVRSELFRQLLDSKVQSVTRSHQRAKPDDIYKFWNAWPSPNEQRAIVDFLDRETARLDTLMGKKRELIEKLKEKRTALISRTVTRGLPAEAAVKTGLNPRPKLKPSGIEWLGDIPQDWEVTRLTFVTEKIGDGLHGTPVYSEESEIYFVNGNNLVDGKITFFENTREVSESVHEDYKLPLGPTTLLMSINGTIGNLAVYHGERIVLGKSAAFINCGRKLDRLFLFNLLHADGVKSFFNLELTGTTISNLSLESVRKTPISLPPVPEQVAIVEYLTRETAKLDQMMEKVEAAIAKLQEYRTALITAAVTGKIDVRRKEV